MFQALLQHDLDSLEEMCAQRFHVDASHVPVDVFVVHEALDVQRQVGRIRGHLLLELLDFGKKSSESPVIDKKGNSDSIPSQHCYIVPNFITEPTL